MIALPRVGLRPAILWSADARRRIDAILAHLRAGEDR
jgi:hypothetical protein